MTRAEQNHILDAVARATRAVDWEMGDPNPWNSHSIQSFRDSLRLDDKRLTHAIAFGAHKQPWQSPPDRERVTA